MYFPSPGGCGYLDVLLVPGRPVFSASAALGRGLSGRGCCAARPLASTFILSVAGWALLYWTWLYGTHGSMLPELSTSFLQAHIQGHVGGCVPSHVADEGIAFLPARGKWLLYVIRGCLQWFCFPKPFIFLSGGQNIVPACRGLASGAW